LFSGRKARLTRQFAGSIVMGIVDPNRATLNPKAIALVAIGNASAFAGLYFPARWIDLGGVLPAVLFVIGIGLTFVGLMKL
jgi:hypothetical protein